MNRLEGLPPIYYINLDHRVDKKNYMETVLRQQGLSGTRISATNGMESLDHVLDGTPKGLRPAEIATSISHLRAIQQWITTSDTETALICEDDLSFETIPMWNCSWNDVVARLPYYWEIVQCSITYHPLQQIVVSLHHHQTFDFSCVCYLIRRPYALKLLALYQRGDKWKLDYPSALPLTAEEILYRPGACLSIPLFCYTNQFVSSIQTKEHMATFHEYSRNIVLGLWKHIGTRDILCMHPPLMLEK